MKDLKDYYKILGLKEGVSSEQVTARWMELKREIQSNPKVGETFKSIREVNEAYEVLSDATARKDYDKNTNRDKHDYVYARPWTPSADLERIYSYSQIKRNGDGTLGGMWDISESASTGLWKATIILFGGLGAMAILIIIFH